MDTILDDLSGSGTQSGTGSHTAPRSTRRRRKVPLSSVWCEGNKKIQPKQATSFISALPEELVVEILSRLPPKLFFRCRSVCKYWLSLSSDAFGCNKHLQPTVSGLFHNYYSGNGGFGAASYVVLWFNKVESGDGKISALPRLNCMNVLDCCNGFLLLSALSKRWPFIKELYVYNPATQSLSALGSLSNFQNKDHSYSIFSLAFDIQTPSLLHLICIGGRIKGKVMLDCVVTFSFEEGKCKCKQGKKLAPDMMVNRYSEGTFLDGRVHHLTTQNKILSIDPNNCFYRVICQSDLENLILVKMGQSQGLLNCMSVAKTVYFVFGFLRVTIDSSGP